MVLRTSNLEASTSTLTGSKSLISLAFRAMLNGTKSKRATPGRIVSAAVNVSSTSGSNRIWVKPRAGHGGQQNQNFASGHDDAKPNQ